MEPNKPEENKPEEKTWYEKYGHSVRKYQEKHKEKIRDYNRAYSKVYNKRKYHENKEELIRLRAMEQKLKELIPQ